MVGVVLVSESRQLRPESPTLGSSTSSTRSAGARDPDPYRSEASIGDPQGRCVVGLGV